MYRRIVMVALVLAATAAQGQTADKPADQTVKTGPEITLNTILRKHSDVRMTRTGMVIMRAPSRHVLVARTSETSRETSCVVSVEAADKFLASRPDAKSAAAATSKGE